MFTFDALRKQYEESVGRSFVRRRLRLFSPFELSNSGRFLPRREGFGSEVGNLDRFDMKKKKDTKGT